MERVRLLTSLFTSTIWAYTVILYTGTGEHGVGLGKKEYLYEELGEGTVELMKSIKRTIDPLGLFNPGKVSIRYTFTGIYA